MSGSILLRGPSWRGCLLKNFCTSSSKTIYIRSHMHTFKKCVISKPKTLVSTWCRKDQEHFILSHRRCLSVTHSNRIWVPWIGRVFETEPPAIPKDPPPIPTVGDTTVDCSAVADGLSGSAAEAVSDSGVLTDAISGMILDPPFVELGLATKYLPNHYVHSLLEFVHLNTGLEWWSTIIIGTMLIRIVTLPLYINTRKVTINAQNHMEETKKAQQKVSKFTYSGETLKRYAAQQDLKDLYKRTGTGPVRIFLNGSFMSALFITCSMALRQMANVPVPSFAEGGILWFNDLSMADPFYGLPLIAGVLVGSFIHVSLNAGTISGQYSGFARKAKYVPVVLIPLIFGNASCAVFLYGITTGTFSLCALTLLNIPAVREKLKIPERKAPTATIAGESVGPMAKFREMRNQSYETTYKKIRVKEIRSEKKRSEKERKKRLKGDPPVTYEIGIEAIQSAPEVPDFERDWRPQRPKYAGQF